jgi:hypothetical protein
MKNIFTDHPHSIGESYFQHFCFALKFGSQMVIGGLACIMHAVFPFMFKKTGSDYLIKMTDDFICRMPVVEERIMVLARSIEQKKCQTPPACTKNNTMSHDTQHASH